MIREQSGVWGWICQCSSPAKRALSAATARWHAATSGQPAAVAIPCTLAITRLGHAMDRLHQLRAAVEQALVEGSVAADHLVQVVAGGEGDARALQHDRRHVGPRAEGLQHSDQLVRELV